MSNPIPTEKVEFLPYGRQCVDEDDVAAVVAALRSDFLTTGPRVAAFEEAFAAYVGAKYAVSFSSGTAALHGAVFAAGVEAGDEAITTPMTFCATANCVLYQGGVPRFADVTPDTLTIDPDSIENLIGNRTKAILPVDYAGHPADLAAVMAIAAKYGLTVIEDACHALGAVYKDKKVGSIADMTTFSFHPVKHITTGEGGMVTTNHERYAAALRRFRNHGIDVDFEERLKRGQWFYRIIHCGYNYRLTDIQCALGISQLKKVERFLERRAMIAKIYSEQLAGFDNLLLPAVLEDVRHAWHLYPIRAGLNGARPDRDELFEALRNARIGVNVHYIPVHLHPLYRDCLGTGPNLCPVAEEAYNYLLSLPIFPGMSDADVDRVVAAVKRSAH